MTIAMLLRPMILRVAACFLLTAAFVPPALRAQAPPGPLPQTEQKEGPSSAAPASAPRPDVPRTKILAGTWRLSLDESDDPAKQLQQARSSDSNGQSGGRRSGGMGGGGWPGGGGMGGGGLGGRGGMGGGGRGQNGGSESDSDREKIHIFVEPAQQLTIAQKEPEIDVADDSDRKFAFYTDDRKLEKSKDPSHQELNAKWQDYRLVAEGKDPKGNKYERSYEVLDGNQQLRETLLLKVGRNSTEVSIRYVYDLVSAPPKTQQSASH